jgi:hypothetical protein
MLGVAQTREHDAPTFPAGMVDGTVTSAPPTRDRFDLGLAQTVARQEVKGDLPALGCTSISSGGLQLSVGDFVVDSSQSFDHARAQVMDGCPMNQILNSRARVAARRIDHRRYPVRSGDGAA